jgi:hypothetical protein
MISINIPYHRKHIGKSRGATWNPEAKTWEINGPHQLSKFPEWANIVSSKGVYVIEGETICWKCENQTPVISLAFDGTVIAESNKDVDASILHESKGLFLLQYVMNIPEPLKMALTSSFPHFKEAYSKMMGTRYWANHCAECGVLMGDYHLHEEPGEPFFLDTLQPDFSNLKIINIPLKHQIALLSSVEPVIDRGPSVNDLNVISLGDFLSKEEL